MKYRGTPNYDHATAPKIGVLLTNLGTPDAPTRKAVRPYLKQFLADPRVIEVPRIIWWFILNVIILNLRPSRSAKAYKEVWTERGSPLLIHLEDQVAGVAAKLKPHWGDNVIVCGAMRYGSPSIPAALQSLAEAGVQRLVVLPLYPQYAAPTTASTFDAIAQDFQRRRWLPDLRFISSYHDDPGYIDALVQSIQQHWRAHGRADKLIFSYHGTPKDYLLKGDPYHCQCHKTTRLVTEALDLAPHEYMSTFQSRVGAAEWLRPYTDDTLKKLPSEGVKSLQVICPGFSADCLETIEEIGIENHDYFMDAGGERYEYIPCLNSDAAHIDLLSDLIERELSGWAPVKYDAALTGRLAAQMHND